MKQSNVFQVSYLYSARSLGVGGQVTYNVNSEDEARKQFEAEHPGRLIIAIGRVNR